MILAYNSHITINPDLASLSTLLHRWLRIPLFARLLATGPFVKFFTTDHSCVPTTCIFTPRLETEFENSAGDQQKYLSQQSDWLPAASVARRRP